MSLTGFRRRDRSKTVNGYRRKSTPGWGDLLKTEVARDRHLFGFKNGHSPRSQTPLGNGLVHATRLLALTPPRGISEVAVDLRATEREDPRSAIAGYLLEPGSAMEWPRQVCSQVQLGNKKSHDSIPGRRLAQVFPQKLHHILEFRDVAGIKFHQGLVGFQDRRGRLSPRRDGTGHFLQGLFCDPV